MSKPTLSAKQLISSRQLDAIPKKKRARKFELLTSQDILLTEKEHEPHKLKSVKGKVSDELEVEKVPTEKIMSKRRRKSSSLKPLFKKKAILGGPSIGDTVCPSLESLHQWFPNVSKTEWLRLKALEDQARISSRSVAFTEGLDDQENELKMLEDLVTQTRDFGLRSYLLRIVPWIVRRCCQVVLLKTGKS